MQTNGRRRRHVLLERGDRIVRERRVDVEVLVEPDPADQTDPFDNYRQIREELRRRNPGDTLVPIDRDPVPSRYAESVRRYYENLGKE